MHEPQLQRRNQRPLHEWYFVDLNDTCCGHQFTIILDSLETDIYDFTVNSEAKTGESKQAFNWRECMPALLLCCRPVCTFRAGGFFFSYRSWQLSGIGDNQLGNMPEQPVNLTEALDDIGFYFIGYKPIR